MTVFLLSIYIALILVRPMEWWEPILNWELVNVVAIVTILAAIPKFLKDNKALTRSLPELKAGALFVVAAALSWLPSFWLTGMQSTFQDLGKLYVLYYLILLLGRSDKAYQVILWTILLCTIFLAIHAILQIQTGFGFGNKPPLWRLTNRETGEGVWQAKAFGIFDDPNDLCLMFIMAIPLFYAELRAGSSPLSRGLALLGIPTVAYGAWLTNSRGGYLGIFAMVIAYLMFRTKGFKRWFLLAFSLLFLTVFAPSRFAAGLSGQQDRSILWGDGMAMFKAHPIFGVGFGDFISYSDDRQVAHNSYVHVLAETGIVGYLPFFMLFYFTMVHGSRAMHLGNQLSQKDRLQLAGIYAAAVGYLTSIYFLSRQDTNIPYLVLALVTVKTVNACRTHEQFAQVFKSGSRDFQRAVLWGLGSIVFMWITIRVLNAAG